MTTLEAARQGIVTELMEQAAAAEGIVAETLRQRIAAGTAVICRNNRHTHGTGCSYAAALATLLAQGDALPAAAQRAKRFIDAAIRNAVPLGSGHGPINHAAGAAKILIT